MPFIATRSTLMRLALCLACVVGSGRARAQEAPPPSVDVRYVSVEGTPMRSAPSGTARRLGTVARGTAVVVRSQRGAWAEIELADDGQSAWISLRALTLRRPRRSDAEIRRILIRESIDDYDGNCPCPYFTDSIGRSCGRRSAWSRAGGESPYCYPRDVPPEAVEAWRQANEAAEAPPAVVTE